MGTIHMHADLISALSHVSAALGPFCGSDPGAHPRPLRG